MENSRLHEALTYFVSRGFAYSVFKQNPGIIPSREPANRAILFLSPEYLFVELANFDSYHINIETAGDAYTCYICNLDTGSSLGHFWSYNIQSILLNALLRMATNDTELSKEIAMWEDDFWNMPNL